MSALVSLDRSFPLSLDVLLISHTHPLTQTSRAETVLSYRRHIKHRSLAHKPTVTKAVHGVNPQLRGLVLS